MKRRVFLEISAAATAAVMLGSITTIRKSRAYEGVSDHNRHFKGYLRMRGGCGDYRVMNDFIPGFFEREIVDNWA
jgi:hypothetical protein